MTKPTKWLCAQQRLRSAWASAQSYQSLRCALNGWLKTQAFFMRTAKTLIRLGGCPGWSESSLGAHSFCWFCHVAAQMVSILSDNKVSFPDNDRFMVRLWQIGFEPPRDKTNKVNVRPAKTQISLGIQPIWSVFAVRSMGSQGPKLSSCEQRRLWSDWAHNHIVCFVMRRQFPSTALAVCNPCPSLLNYAVEG